MPMGLSASVNEPAAVSPADNGMKENSPLWRCHCRKPFSVLLRFSRIEAHRFLSFLFFL